MVRILIVEDNDLNMKLFQDLLLIQDYDIITSRNGEGVIDIVLEERPNLILMDIQLGGISGIDLIKELKANAATRQIPIIAVTAFAMANEEATITASGCDLYLSKPVSIDNFFYAINKFV